MRTRWVVGDRIFALVVLTISLAGFAIFASAALGLLARDTASVSHNIILQAGLGLGLGFIACVLARLVPLIEIKKRALWLYLGSLAFTALVFVPGIGLRFGGATRWIDVGFTTLQPAEFLKIGFVVMLAAWLAPRARQFNDVRKGLIPFATLLALPAMLLLAQPNTSTTLLLCVTGSIMYFVAGAPLRDFFILALVVIVGFGLLISVRPYVLDRVKTFLHPSAADSLGSGYQIQQALIAIGSGGLVGRGFGQGIEKFNYLPEPDGDSVFAVFAEETGFVGALLLLGLFLTLAARGMVIAGNSRDLFGGLLALGFSSLIMIQAFINIGAMLGLAPLTGLPLPFVSHGGTALLATLAMCGLILNVAAHKNVS